VPRQSPVSVRATVKAPNHLLELTIYMKLAHVAIAVRNAEEALRLFAETLGLEPSHTEKVESQKVNTIHIPLGDTSIELLEATSPESPVARFIEKRGEGLHHIAIVVDDIRDTLSRLKAAGYRLIDEEPRRGARNMLIAFVHPKSTHGVLLELCQPTD